MQKAIYILWPFLIYYVVHDVAQILLVFMLRAGMEVSGTDYMLFVQTHEASLGGVVNALAMLAGMGAVMPMVFKESGVMKGKKKEAGFMAYGLMVVLAVTLSMGMNLLFAFTGLVQVSQQYTEVAARQYGVAFALGLVLYGVISPMAEEVVFRRLIYNRLKKNFRIPIAIFVCGLLFGFYHGNIVQGIYGWILGMMITFIYEWYGSLWAPIVFHGAANLCIFIASYDAEKYKRLQTPVSLLVCMMMVCVSLWGIIRLQNKKADEEQ